MTSPLRKNISNDYFSAVNKLGGKKAQRQIAVYVESYDDLSFWRAILLPFENDKNCKFQIYPYTSLNNTIRHGKSAAIKELSKNAGRDMIVCVDADLDYLRQGSNDLSQVVCTNEYVFHTYAYAIENLQCWAPALRELCIKATNNDKPHFDFQTFLRDYSRKIYPLFLWVVYSARHSKHNYIDLKTFMAIIRLGDTTHDGGPRQALKRVGERVQDKLKELLASAPAKHRAEIAKLDNELRNQLDIKPEETYLYVRGHDLMDVNILPLLNAECAKIIQHRENDINKNCCHELQRQNEIQGYRNSLKPIDDLLKSQEHFLKTEQVKRIRKDLLRIFN